MGTFCSFLRHRNCKKYPLNRMHAVCGMYDGVRADSCCVWAQSPQNLGIDTPQTNTRFSTQRLYGTV